MCQKPIIMMKNVVDVTFLREEKKPNGKDENVRGERNLKKQLRYLPSKNDIGICFSFPLRDGAIFFRAWRKKKSAATAAMGFIHAIVGWHQMKPRPTCCCCCVVVTVTDENETHPVLSVSSITKEGNCEGKRKS